jgi:phage terminase large subunit
VNEPTIELNYAPSPKQAMAHRRPERYKLYGGAMGGGKSWWICGSIIRACMKWPGSRWYLSRKEAVALKRTTLLTWRDMLPTGIVERHNKSDGLYQFINGSEVWYGGLGTKEDKDKIKSMELTGFAIDEASEVEEDFFLMLSSRLGRLDSKVPGVRNNGLLASNPEPGWVRHRFVDQVLPDHVFVPALPSDNPNLSPDYETNLRELFRGCPAWASAYLDGDWDAFAGTNFVLAYANVKTAAERTISVPSGRECIGVDVARYGDDETVLIFRHGPDAKEMETYSHQSTTETAGRVTAMKRRHPRAGVNIDVGAMGAGVVDICRENGVYVNEVNFGGKAQDPEHYADWASEALAGTLQDRFNDGDISIPDDTRLRAQLTSRRYEMTKKGQVKIESKDKMKSRGLPSPDRADTLMLAFAPVNKMETVRLN